MLSTLAISNYRSVHDLVLPLGPLNVITGANGVGKSNVHRALRLLVNAVQGSVVNALAREGGLESTFWAGPANVRRHQHWQPTPVQDGSSRSPKRLRLGFSGPDLGYSIALGLPIPSDSAFGHDPEVKHECIWAGGRYRPASVLVERTNAVVRARQGSGWCTMSQHLPSFETLFSHIGNDAQCPEVFHLREHIRQWRFYDHFRCDPHAPARQPQLGTRSPVLHHNGRDLAAALQTIIEIGDTEALNAAISDAFDGARLQVQMQAGGRFMVGLQQKGLLRALGAEELSDGTLRYLLLTAALLTPRPPSLMVLNEPETSLHPDLLPALGRLIANASQHTQIWVVSHARRLVAALEEHPSCNTIELDKQLGQTLIPAQGLLDKATWKVPDSAQ